MTIWLASIKQEDTGCLWTFQLILNDESGSNLNQVHLEKYEQENQGYTLIKESINTPA